MNTLHKIMFWFFGVMLAVSICGIVSRLFGWKWFFTPVKELFK